MTYAPPSGWIERTDEPTDERTRVNARFHRRADCERIYDPRALVQVDKPYHAPRLRPGVTSSRARPLDRRGTFVVSAALLLAQTYR
jgi:hypothetical protein